MHSQERRGLSCVLCPAQGGGRIDQEGPPSSATRQIQVRGVNSSIGSIPGLSNLAINQTSGVGVRNLSRKKVGGEGGLPRARRMGRQK